MGSDSDLTRLATLVAHEMRTPLSVVSGYLKMLASERQGPLTEAQRRSVDGATRAALLLTTLAADVSLLAKVVRGEVSSNRTAVAVGPLLAELATAHTPIDEHPVQVEASPLVESVTLTVDASNLRRALTTLLAAVVRAAPDHATVQLAAARSSAAGPGGRRDRSSAAEPQAAPAGQPVAKAAVVIAVAPAATIEPLLAADPDTLDAVNESTGGLGVGLPLARWLLALDGGEIRAQQTPQGLGVLVRLPA